MNLILLYDEDFVSGSRVVLRGRRRDHIATVLRSSTDDGLRVGLLGGSAGKGKILRLDEVEVELEVVLTEPPPPPLPLTLILALPRPKVFNRVVAAATSLGVKEIHLINSWRVEKSYWSSPRLEQANLRAQIVSGLEQARDTIAPVVHLHRLFTPFAKEILPSLGPADARRLIAHPSSFKPAAPADGETILAIGPEGGFIEREVDAFERTGFERVTLGPRILRVETALPVLAGRLFRN